MGLMIIYFDAMIKARVGEKQTDIFFDNLKLTSFLRLLRPKFQVVPSN